MPGRRLPEGPTAAFELLGIFAVFAPLEQEEELEEDDPEEELLEEEEDIVGLLWGFEEPLLKEEKDPLVVLEETEGVFVEHVDEDELLEEKLEELELFPSNANCCCICCICCCPSESPFA